MLKKSEEYGASNVLGIWSAINIILESDKFIIWMKNQHSYDKSANLFVGYRLLIETCLRSILNSILNNPAIELKEDYVYFRARHRGIRLSKIPNTCDKIIFFKNFYHIIRKIRKSNNFEEIKTVNKQIKNSFLESLEKLYNEDTEVNPELKITKEEAIKFAAMYWVLIYLNQINNGIPMGYGVSCLGWEIPEKDYFDGLLGYKYGLQYIWACLLGEDYANTKLTKLHNVKSWDFKIDFEPVKSKEVKEKKRKDLDRFFSYINDYIITPLQKKYNFNVFLNDVLFFKRKITKDYFKILLGKVPEPKLTAKEELDFKLFWYGIEAIDSASSNVFNGVPLFIPLLLGTIELKAKYDIDEKSFICKFIHPDKSVNGNDYSYGILIQSYGSFFSDFSGWVMFYDCCTDYSGFGGDQHAKAEARINELKKLNLIEVREMVIPKNFFKKYISQVCTYRQISDKDKLINDAKAALDSSRGIILELLTYYYISKYGEGNVDWNIQEKGDQIDVTIEKENEFILIECKNSVINTKDEIKKARKKLSNYNTNKKDKKIEFWFWESISPITKEILEKENITYKILQEEIKENPKFSKKLDKVKFIFDRNRLFFPR